VQSTKSGEQDRRVIDAVRDDGSRCAALEDRARQMSEGSASDRPFRPAQLSVIVRFTVRAAAFFRDTAFDAGAQQNRVEGLSRVVHGPRLMQRTVRDLVKAEIMTTGISPGGCAGRGMRRNSNSKPLQYLAIITIEPRRDRSWPCRYRRAPVPRVPLGHRDMMHRAKRRDQEIAIGGVIVHHRDAAGLRCAAGAPRRRSVRCPQHLA